MKRQVINEIKWKEKNEKESTFSVDDISEQYL